MRFSKGTISPTPFTLFQVTGMTVIGITFYINYLVVLPRVFNPFKWWKALIGFTLMMLLFLGLRYFTEQWLTVRLFNRQNYFPGFSFLFYTHDNLYFGSRPIIISTVFWLIIRLMRLSDYNKFILEEKKNAEIKFLKAQINPHFIFNTLNNIYSMVFLQSPKSLSAIEKLSSIIRFTTYESQKEKIKLSDELDYIQSYVELEQLRHEQEGFVILSKDVNETDINIPPYILFPFVENALKHGIASPAYPVEIELKANKKSLYFTVTNAIGNKKKDKPGGIGLDNVKKRLEIYYPNKHLLTIQNDQHNFTIHLQIHLQ
ncbi:sensor histidine kinase [Chitinophagaceae bacterium LWZ2-11]